MPRISLITVCYNSAATIVDTLSSVAMQSYKDLEHIIVDGGSTDGTVEIIKNWVKHPVYLISEPDEGIYDAMNKGIDRACGDLIGLINADDFYINEHVIEDVASAFNSSPIKGLYADLVFVRPGNLDKIVRYCSGADFTPAKFAYGWMPPHPTVFLKRECYLEYGLFKTDYRIAADFELLARYMVKHRIHFHYLPEVIIKMRTGGKSTRSLKSNVILNDEILRACTEIGIPTNMFKIYSKYFRKSLQLFARPK